MSVLVDNSGVLRYNSCNDLKCKRSLGIMFDELDVFDDLVVEEDEVHVSGVSVDNEDLAERLKSEGKSVVTRGFTKERVYPYFEICLTADAQIHSITLEAIQSLLTTGAVHPDSADGVIDVLTAENGSITVGVSTDTTLTKEPQEKVLGTLPVSKIRYLFALVRNVNTRFWLSSELVFEGSKVLALV